MEDLLKDLAQAKPPTPEVDHDRMERDLARILSTPRLRPARSQFLRRFAPLLVVAAVIVVAVIALPSPSQPVRPAAPPQWWRVLTQHWSLMVVGEPANPYVVRFNSTTDQWVAADSQISVVQKDGDVAPFSLDDDNKWTAAGKPTTAPQVGGNYSVRIGPMKPAVQKTNIAGFQMSAHSKVRFDSIDTLPADPVELKKVLETIAGKDTYQTAMLAMGMMLSNGSWERRQALFDLLEQLDGVRFLGQVNLRNGRSGIGVAISAPSTFQFSGVETQLVINPETGMPIVKRDVLTTPQHGLSANMSISEEEYLLLEKTTIDPILPPDVAVNGEVESPIIER
ncbi:hypothetical protein FXN61_13395 [Lentzea sp. PSKA42]|uniref:Uncharacterized protein n=1 Tax=Lentzea indica TaxID=2604800 RepID=A0ABX1FFS1_9PSEU|nr:hypothetical protein [Lentzea indica]NKE57775.1 hypothetical protein [Lentzea indica]